MENGGLGKIEVRRMGQKQKIIRQKERQDQAEERERRYTEKWDQTDSPKIHDRGGRHQNRRPPFGGTMTRWGAGDVDDVDELLPGCSRCID